MAKIPLGNFGQAIAQPAPPVRQGVYQPAFDDGGSGAQKLGDTGIRVAGAIMEEQRQEAERLAREKQHQDAALVRAQAANVMLDREIAIETIGKEVEQQVAIGAIPYAEAPTAYKQRVGNLAAPDMTGMDPVTAENFGRGLKRIDFKGESFISGVVAKAKHADLRMQTDALLDKLGKQAGLPGTDMAAVQAQITALDEIGTQAYGAAWGKRKQDWTDNTWDARLNQQAMAVRNDLAGMQTLERSITEGEYADKLDSNRRNALVAKLAGYRTSLIQRNEAAAARGQREQERRLKNAEAAFNTFQALADKGTILAPEYVDQAVHATSGTPYQQGIRALAQQSQETGGIAAQPVAAQQALLDQLDAKIAAQGRTPALDKRREQVDKVLRASLSDLKDNGLRAGLERGVISDLAKIDLSTPQSFAASVVKRKEQGEIVSTWAGETVSILGAREAGQLRDMLGALPPKQRAEAVATISDALGTRFSGAVAEQIDKHDRALSLAFAVGGDKAPAQTTWFGMKKSDERLTSELILKGATAIKDGTVMKDDKKVTGWKATIAGEVDGLFPDARLETAAKDSAYYIAAGIAQENGGSVSTSELRRAVRLAVGGDIIERNGKKLPIPAGMDASAFEDRLRSLPASGIAKQAPDGKVRVAGVDMPVADFTATIAGQELLSAGPGRYAVIVRGRPVMNTAGRPIIVEVR